MKFKEYIGLVKRLLRDNVSNSDLLDLLFRHVIDKYRIQNKNGEPYAFDDKGNVSRIINGERNVPKELTSHFNDSEILISMADYWETTLVKRLTKDDLFIYREIRSILDNDFFIHPSNKRIYYYLLAKKQFGVLLANMLIESVRTGKDVTIKVENNDDISDATICLNSIDEDNNVSNDIKLIKFDDVTGVHSADKIEEIKRRIYEIKGITNKEPDEGSKNRYEMLRRELSINEDKIVVPDTNKRLISDFAKEQNMELGYSFFDLWGLRIFRGNQRIKTATRTGTDSEKRKCKLIEELCNEIREYNKITYLDAIFGNTYGIKLAITNSGNIGDSKVRVGLFIPKTDVFTSEDIIKNNDRILETVRGSWNLDRLLTIERSTDYMDYTEACWLTQSDEYKIARTGNYWNDCIINPLYVDSKNDDMYFELEFEKIMQNTTIAFPKTILLKNKPSRMRYTIVSNNMTNKVDIFIDIM